MTHPLRTITLAVIAIAGMATVSLAHARSDASFMKEAAEAGDAELEAGKLAQSKARRPEVKAFADAVIKDHSKLSEELKQLATAKKVDLPSGATVVQKSKLKLIQAGDDAKFDERYVQSFGIKAHEDTIKLFEEAAREAKDSDVKAFAQKNLPTLQQHLQMAKTLGVK